MVDRFVYALDQLKVTQSNIRDARLTLFGDTRKNSVLRLAQIAILAFSALFILLHISGGLLSRAKVAPFEELWDRGLMRLDVDWSLVEFFEYGLMLVSVLAFLYSWKIRRIPAFLALAAVDTLFLADNALKIHERGGGLLSTWVEAPYAEIVVFLAIATISLVLVIPALLKSEMQPAHWCLLSIGCLIGAAVCAVVLDFVHVTWRGSIYVDHLLSVAEDGGELIFISLHTIVSLAIAGHVAAQFKRH